jgi:enamine deaminase RidA (YjgF/YER057c/UK114 family)
VIAVPEMKFKNPTTLGKPLGRYSHLTRVRAFEFVLIAGQVGVDKEGKLTSDGGFDAQCLQAFANINAALKSVGAGWGNIVQFTTYLVHSQSDIVFPSLACDVLKD